MAHPKVEQDLVLDKLFEVFRSMGYDGASMTELSNATGLKKASLYHRFPDGKSSMASAVLDNVEHWIQMHIVDVIDSSGSPQQRLKTVLESIDELYNGGKVACILRSLSNGSATSIFREKIAAIFRKWMDAFGKLAMDFGHQAFAATRLAESAVIQIQGTLILTETLENPVIFRHTLDSITSQFSKPDSH